jgi:hypothetical protein
VAGILPLGTIGVTGTVVVVTVGEPFWFAGADVVVGATVDVVDGALVVDVGALVVDVGGTCNCSMWFALTVHARPGICGDRP